LSIYLCLPINWILDFLQNNYFPLINVDPILSGVIHALSQEMTNGFYLEIHRVNQEWLNF